MQKSGVLFLILAILIALMGTWLHNLWLQQQSTEFESTEKQIDYYLSDFSLLVTDPKGQMKYRMQGEHFVHHQQNKESDIYRPRVQARSNDAMLTLEAEKAKHSGFGDIDLRGDVKLDIPETKQTPGFSLQSESLVYSPTKREIATKDSFSLKTTDGNIMNGTGMSENLDEQILRINSNVQTKFLPTNAQ
jgi:LPS export ABC transporter protein LptC